MIEVLFIAEDFSKNFYGVTTAIQQICTLLKNTDITIQTIYPKNCSDLWKISFNLGKELTSKIINFSIIHLHGVWMYPQYIGAKLAIKYNKSFILSPHGMLEPWLMERKNIGIFKYLKKNYYFKFIALPLFQKATFIHAITPLEKNNLSKYFAEEKIVVIPNAIDVEKIRQYIKVRNTQPKKRILFVGRLHPIKGVEILIKAFLQRKFFEKDWELCVVGPEEVPEYVDSLKQMYKGYEKFVKFLGPVFNEKKKFLLYASSWITVVPSYSEVMGMVNLESASCYTPTITTYKTGLLDWEKGGNILIHPNVEDLVKALSEVTEWSLEERLRRGENAYNLVKSRYSKETVKRLWVELYRNVVEINQNKKGDKVCLF